MTTMADDDAWKIAALGSISGKTPSTERQVIIVDALMAVSRSLYWDEDKKTVYGIVVGLRTSWNWPARDDQEEETP